MAKAYCACEEQRCSQIFPFENSKLDKLRANLTQKTEKLRIFTKMTSLVELLPSGERTFRLNYSARLTSRSRKRSIENTAQNPAKFPRFTLDEQIWQIDIARREKEFDVFLIPDKMEGPLTITYGEFLEKFSDFLNSFYFTRFQAFG